MRTKKETSDKSVKVICLLPQRGGSSWDLTALAGWLSERGELMPAGGSMPAGESVKVIGLEGRDVAGTRFNLRQNY